MFRAFILVTGRQSFLLHKPGSDRSAVGERGLGPGLASPALSHPPPSCILQFCFFLPLVSVCVLNLFCSVSLFLLSSSFTKCRQTWVCAWSLLWVLCDCTGHLFPLGPSFTISPVSVSSGCCNNTGWCVQRQAFVSHSPEGWKSTIKVLADLVPGENSPGLQMAPFLLCPHMTSSLCAQERHVVSLLLL